MNIDGNLLLQNLTALLGNRPLVLGAGPRILIAAQPKSGSTWFSAQLSAMTGIKQYPLIPAYGGREQELSELRLALLAQTPFVACHHVRGSAATQLWMDRFGLKTIVLVRNLYDVVVSTNDHLDREGLGGGNPMLWLEPEFLKRSREERLDLLVDLLVPWHLHFFLSWSVSGRKDLEWVRYEDVFGEGTTQAMAGICERMGLPYRVDAARQGADFERGTRRNVGRSGRGKEQLSAAQIERIERMVAHYPQHDFSILGVGKS